MLVVMIGIRKSLDLIFTRRELKILDDIMPEMTKRNQHDALKDVEVGWAAKITKFCLGSGPVIRDNHEIQKLNEKPT